MRQYNQWLYFCIYIFRVNIDVIIAAGINKATVGVVLLVCVLALSSNIASLAETTSNS